MKDKVLVFLSIFLAGTTMCFLTIFGIAGLVSFLFWDITPLQKFINLTTVRISIAVSLFVTTIGFLHEGFQDGK